MPIISNEYDNISVRVKSITLKVESKNDITMNNTIIAARLFSLIKLFFVPCWMQSVQ
jgi:hypothetical protein